jgi:hypothetical protein
MRISKILSIRRVIIFGIIIFCVVTQLTAQIDSLSNRAQFLYPDFSTGVVKMKDGKTTSATMNYNTLTEKMTFYQNGTLMDMIKPETVDTITLQNNKFVFLEDAFLEVLVNGHVTLFIQHKSDLSSTGRPGPYGTKSQTSGPVSVPKLYTLNNTYNLKLPVEYVVTPSPVNWIRIDNEMHKILSNRQFFKLFPGNEDKIKEYINKNKLNIKKTDDLVKIVIYCNTLSK